MRRFALTAALLMACGSPASDSEAERVADATLTGWASADLPEPPASCHFDRFAIEEPETEADFRRLCKLKPGEKGNSCFRFLLVTPRVQAIEYPAAIINPLHDGTVEGLAVHEAFHGLCYCAIEHTWVDQDPSDYAHADQRVWKKYGPESAEAIARELLGSGRAQ